MIDALLKCNITEAANSIELLEDAFERELAELPSLPADSKGQHCKLIAKYMCLVSNQRGSEVACEVSRVHATPGLPCIQYLLSAD